MAEPPIRYEDRIFVCGTTSSGKSQLARRLYLASAAPRLVIDPANSALTNTPGAVTFHDPTTGVTPSGDSWHDAATARFVPADPYDLSAYSALYDYLFARAQAGRPCWVWCDEARYVFPSDGGRNRGGLRAIAQGRKFGLGHLACHTRPRWVRTDLVSEAAHVFLFDLPAAADRAYVADNIGITASELDAAHAQLDPHGYLWWRQRTRELLICEPLPRSALA